MIAIIRLEFYSYLTLKKINKADGVPGHFQRLIYDHLCTVSRVERV